MDPDPIYELIGEAMQESPEHRLTIRPDIVRGIMSADLERIARYARHTMNDTISLIGAVRILRGRPDFETRAEDAIKSAEAELEHALRVVKQAREQFAAKPIHA